MIGTCTRSALRSVHDGGAASLSEPSCLPLRHVLKANGLLNLRQRSCFAETRTPRRVFRVRRDAIIERLSQRVDVAFLCGRVDI